MILGLPRGSINPRTDITPRAVIKRFFLTPHQTRVGVFIQVRRDEIVRERRELFDAADGDVFDPEVFPRLGECEVDLAGAEDVALDLVGGEERGGVVWFGEVSEELGVVDHFV